MHWARLKKSIIYWFHARIDGVDTMWRRVASIVCSKFYRNVDLNDPKVSYQEVVTTSHRLIHRLRQRLSGLPMSKKVALATYSRCLKAIPKQPYKFVVLRYRRTWHASLFAICSSQLNCLSGLAPGTATSDARESDR